jgi:hypothetical protein
LTGPWQVRFNAGSWGKGFSVHTVGPGPADPSLPEWNGNWVHYTGVLGQDSLKLYVNGELAQVQRHRGGVGPTESLWRVGSNVEFPRTRQPNGILDEVRIYRRALTEGEIRDIIQDVQEVN